MTIHQNLLFISIANSSMNSANGFVSNKFPLGKFLNRRLSDSNIIAIDINKGKLAKSV